jgi:hypothetical protein
LCHASVKPPGNNFSQRGEYSRPGAIRKQQSPASLRRDSASLLRLGCGGKVVWGVEP